eukprot:s39_g43.t1
MPCGYRNSFRTELAADAFELCSLCSQSQQSFLSLVKGLNRVLVSCFRIVSASLRALQQFTPIDPCRNCLNVLQGLRGPKDPFQCHRGEQAQEKNLATNLSH